MDWNQILTNFVNWCATEGVKIVIAFVILIIGFIIVNALVKGPKPENQGIIGGFAVGESDEKSEKIGMV